MATLTINSFEQAPSVQGLMLRFKQLWQAAQGRSPRVFANQSHLPNRVWQRHSALISASRRDYRLR